MLCITSIHRVQKKWEKKYLKTSTFYCSLVFLTVRPVGFNVFTFFYKVLNSVIDAPALLSKISSVVFHLTQEIL